MNNRLIEVAEKLKSNGFQVKTFEDSVAAKEELLKNINDKVSVTIGGSMTISSMGVYDDLINRGNKVYWHWKEKFDKDKWKETRNTDIFISSTNALTLDGKLVNMDGVANRVSAMIYGHENVYIVVGKNKLCKDYEEAKHRIETIAAPKNAERLNLSTPCRFTGKCNDCNSPQRMCNGEVIIHKNTGGTNINIYLVDEELGY